ncbi:MAG: nitrogen regulation protein NR(II) [Nitrospinaceae bacterium]
MFQNIFSSLIDGVLLISKDLKILKGNPAVEEMFHRSRDSFEDQPLADFFPNQPEVLGKVGQTLTLGFSFHDIECLGWRKNNPTPFPANLTLSPFRDPEGNIDGAVILVKDLSLLKELEEISRPMDHLSAIGTLALGMAHEIRNPLGGIRGSAQLLRQELGNPQHQEYLDVVISEVDRINRMVERIMDFTRPKTLEIKEINIHEILGEIILLEKESLSRKRCRVEQVYDPSLPLIEADKDQLKQVFLNLIKNAREASRERGKIQLITRVGTGYSIKTSRDPNPKKSIVVEVIDSGSGMEEAILKNIFTPFFTTKKRGSGLGMSISLKLVENHGGKIKVTSEKGLGTTVQVFLPVRHR